MIRVRQIKISIQSNSLEELKSKIATKLKIKAEDIKI